MDRMSQRLRLEHTRQETGCREKEETQDVCVTNLRTDQCCEEHRQRLELFCQEDEAFICVLCVPRHSSHRTVFLHEAVSMYKDKLKTALVSLESKVKYLKYLRNKQEKEILDIQEDGFSLEQYIKREFAKLHQFLQDKKQKLLQQLQKAEANILKEMEENPGCIIYDIDAFHVVLSAPNLEHSNEAEILKEMGTNSECFENVILAIHPMFDSNPELRQKESMGLLTENALSLEQYITQEFAKLHQTLQVGEEKRIQQLKTEGTNIAKEMEENLECVKHNLIDSNMAMFFGSLEVKKKEAGSVKVMEEPLGCTESDVIGTQETSDNCLKNRQQEPVGLLTLPETFEDIAVTFSEEEWKILREQDKDLHREVMVQNYEAMVSVGYKISPKALLLLLKDDALPKRAPEGKNNTKEQYNLEAILNSNRSTECNMSCSHHRTLGICQLCQPGEILQQCAQPAKGDKKSQLTHVTQLMSENNCSKSFERDISPTEKSPYKCTECTKCFMYKSQLSYHQSTHILERPYKCTECGMGFTLLYNLKWHLAVHSGEQQIPYKCTESSTGFTQLSTLQLHAIHTEEKPYKCAECGKCFQQKGHLTNHRRSHTGKKPYKCTECSQCFTRRDSCQRHIVTHTGTKTCAEIKKEERLYKCAKCSKCFKQKSYLKYHESYHTGMKPYTCTECSKCFVCPSSLRSHLLIHTGNKPYKCTECSKCFTRKSHLEYHENYACRSARCTLY